MNSPTTRLAAVNASTDAAPRVIQQFPALFLVTPLGDVWRVFDSEEPSGANRIAATSDARAVARVFMNGGTQPVVRIYLFRDDESRSTAAESLFAQLIASTAAV